ncbi:oxygenase MpaB family protein [Asticcacaulis sp. YBE204]|uniref:oxygenase MpaB family protein n=1 Tax=Asticcacaulis sp. YBE204 TaxID=1282363 RepID=UPI0003C3FF30|nr:oxygenase MpaB family protein [Asticcacaulis sp. YBE204]ESQ80516.1 hypothetical protein AEYBE204_04415 [Asticcacaulis sp. YBE204]
MPTPLSLPEFIGRRIDSAAGDLFRAEGAYAAIDFTQPPGEAALVPPDSLSWRIFKNPVSLYIGGVAAVILELAEPGVRTGVWEHSSFRTQPVQRLKRTGLAAMITVYGAKSVATRMIEGVVRRHDRVTGQTPDGKPYHANDPHLLDWVQATASFGFAEAYSRYVSPLSHSEFDRLYTESAPAAQAYGAVGAPTSQTEMEAIFARMAARLEPSPIVFEFLDIMREAPAFPGLLQTLQPMLIRAAVSMTPEGIRDRLGLGAVQGLRAWEAPLVRQAGALSDRIVIRSSPAGQACRRMGLPEDYLYRS